MRLGSHELIYSGRLTINSVGRTDDVIVLGSGRVSSIPQNDPQLITHLFVGEKVVPIPQEGYLGSLPFVAGVVMFGRGKNQVGVLIEPNPANAIDPKDEQALIEFRNKIW